MEIHEDRAQPGSCLAGADHGRHRLLHSLVTTRTAGPPEAMDQETQFLSALASAAKISGDGDTLTILDEGDTELMVLVVR
ncbi:META domain-containing protein [Tessaracoccus sp.]